MMQLLSDNSPLGDRSPFTMITDTRDAQKVIYPLENILTIAVCSVLAGAEGWEDMESFGRSKQSVLGRFLDLSAGVPKHDVYRRVLNTIPPSVFNEVFIAWTRSRLGSALLGHIAIDGKSVRGSGNTALEQSPLHMVSAWACEHSMVFAQITTDEKSNEITAIPKLLHCLPLKGSLVSTDAMGCQYKIANTIRAGGGSYLFGLKGNQAGLYDDVDTYVCDARQYDFSTLPHAHATTHEKNRGRIETRTARVITDINWLRERHKNWPHIQSLIVIERTRQSPSDTAPQQEVHYYISDRHATPESWLRSIRNHWQVENTLHWTLDVSFAEDACQIHNPIGAENLAILRHLALNILKRDTTRKASIKRKKKLAGWDDEALIDFLKQL